jgi:hypothetical protein
MLLNFLFGSRRPQHRHPASMSSRLPPGWEAFKDQSGNIFFANNTTKATQWTDPRPLPPGWEAHNDMHTGKQYFVYLPSKYSTWTDPRPVLCLKHIRSIAHQKPVIDQNKTMENQNQPQKYASENILALYRKLVQICIDRKKVFPEDENTLKKFREKFFISDVQHVEQMQILGIDLDAWDNMRALSDEDFSLDQGSKCAKCGLKSPEYVVLNCMHVCLCESCAHMQIPHVCPKCKKTALEIRRVFF